MKIKGAINETTGLLYYQKHMSIAEEEDESSTDSNSSISNAPTKPRRCRFFKYSRHFMTSAAGCTIVALVFIVAIKPLTFPFSIQRHHHDHTLPSFLKIRNNDAPKYSFVNVMDNEIYRLMQNENVTFLTSGHLNSAHGDDDVHANANLHVNVLNLDQVEIAVHDNVTVSWDPKLIHAYDDHGQDSLSEVNLDYSGDNVIIALYCPAEESNPRKFVDAASLSQIEGTMAANGMNMREGSMISENGIKHHQWFIRSFPVMMEDTCEFRLWHRSYVNAEDAKAKKIVKPQQLQRDEKLESFILRAKSPVLNIHNGSVAPMTVHLAMTTESDEMMVQFSTGGSIEDSASASIPVVMYGMDPEKMASVSREGNTTTYGAMDLCQAPANLEEPGKFSSPHLLHNVKMTGLVPDTEYYYKVGVMNRDMSDKCDEDSTNHEEIDVKWSEVYSFRSPIPAGMRPRNSVEGNEEPFVFVVYADQGVTGYGGPGNDDGERVSKFTEREIEQHGARVVHHFGDLAYSQGAAHIWDAWLDMVSIFATHVPLMIGVGNHEYDHTAGGEDGKDPSGLMTAGGYNPEWGDFSQDSKGECGVPVSKRFVMPANGNGIYWYSYDHGLVHTVMLSSEHDLSPTSTQYQWLERDLSSIDRTKTPWVIVEAHRPMYMIEDIPSNTLVGIHMRKAFESLLYLYNVDLYLAGHYHAYFRTCGGLYMSKCDNGGLTHITVGTAGAELDSTPLLRRPWSEFYSAEWGYGRITVFNESSLLWEFVSDQDGEVRDSTWLRKG